MTIIRADVLGFCAGVRSAVESAYETLKKNKDKRVYSLGPLIHNQVALDSLAEKGLVVESNLENIEDGSAVIIRAHGVPPETITDLQKKNCTVVDATCHLVRASQRIAQKYSSKNYRVIFAGDAYHGEVVSVAAYAKNNFTLVQNIEDARSIELKQNENAVFFSQTTFSNSAFSEITKILQEKCKALVVLHTICPATKARQDALKTLCDKVDAILVVGGKNSANTKRLLLTAQENGKVACIVERASEIPSEYFSFTTVGISAGASTPDDTIDQVEQCLLKNAV